MPRNRSEQLPEVTPAQLAYLRVWVPAHPEEPVRMAGGAYGTAGASHRFMRMNRVEKAGIQKLSWSVRKAIVHAEKSK